MMNFNMRTKLVALVLSLGVLTSSNVSANNSTSAVTFSNTKILAASSVIALLMAMKVCLDTQPSCVCDYNYDYDIMKEDFNDLLHSYNLLDAESRATVKFLFRKYCVGRKFKKVETTTRTKKDDGTVCTVKGSKVVQKPEGFMGLLDAYVLTQAEGLTKIIPVMAALYVLVNDPYGSFGRAVDQVVTGKK